MAEGANYKSTVLNDMASAIHLEETGNGNEPYNREVSERRFADNLAAREMVRQMSINPIMVNPLLINSDPVD